VVQRQRCPGSGASHRWLRPSLDQIKVVGGCGGSPVNLVQRAAGPHLFL
jgi:hypothetical protein